MPCKPPPFMQFWVSLCSNNLFDDHSAPYAPPPDDVRVVRVEKNLLVFAWNEVTLRCPSTRYVITAINCGVCPSATNDTTVTCSHFNTSTHDIMPYTCMFAVQAGICGYLLGERSDFVSLNLTGKHNKHIVRNPMIRNTAMFLISSCASKIFVQTSSFFIRECNRRDRV